MIEIRRSALVGYAPAQMFDLVNDVEAYPRRFSWCSGAAVEARDETGVTARLDLRFAGLKHSFSTHNTLDPPHRIVMRLVGGPLKNLDGTWTFAPLGDSGCKVQLDLRFDFTSRLVGPALRLGFRGLADRLVDDFCAEAGHAYG